MTISRDSFLSFCIWEICSKLFSGEHTIFLGDHPQGGFLVKLASELTKILV